MRRVLSIVAAILVTACSDSLGPAEYVAVMDIAPQPVVCDDGFGPRECLRVREHPDTAWLLFRGPIEGFTFEPGFQYTIRMLVRPVINPPADGSSLSFHLLEIISKTPG